ncbi:sporulation integral membrane protein YtvI [Paenibacillus sp. M1]|uniref:Sporulation integral membrane protein YtvI n=1 Tax=Paenibacillus haidiansis TaxID=1574488 RepID=A0ABU7VZP3_9BACL
MDHTMTKRLLRGGWVCIVLVLLAFGLYWLLPLIYPFLIAWLIAYAMNPLVRWLQSAAKLPRWLAVTTALIAYVGGTLIVLSAAVTRLVKELIALSETLDFHIAEWRKWFVEWSQSEGIQNIINEINRFIADNPGYENTINKNIDTTTSTISSAISKLLGSLLNGIVGVLTSLPNLGLILIVILLAAFFISKNWERNMRFLSGLVPSPFRKTGGEVWRDLQKALFGYFRAQFIMISITAVIVFIGLLILRVDSAFTYAILIGFVDLLPYLGVGTVMVPWLLYAFMTGDVGFGIGLSILYGVILVARQLLEPKVLATSVGLDPLPTLISMFVGLKLFGVFGLIIGPVSFVVFGAVLRAGVLRDLRNYILNGRLR